MPSPAQTRFVLTGNAAAYPYDEFYKNDDELTADIVAAYRQVIADLYAAGCRNVQFDDCTWTRLCDASVRERLGWSDEDALRLQQENLDVITSKKPDLEDPDTIKARIQEAAQYIPLDRLCLSTQCGFASTQEGNKLTEDQQWAKIALVQSIAKDVWGE